ncbi:hypothetical protein [Bacillus subtilis]|uniref:hypothetical protein n=1 Tax=Bacillus subtilis TaxID=1423 RepID=UPI00034D4039|nr:hypothetical protein [Bacillus subtilis]
MNAKFGLYVKGEHVKTYDDAIQAHKDAIFAQEEIGVPHEVIQMNFHMVEAIEFLNKYDNSSKSAQDAQVKKFKGTIPTKLDKITALFKLKTKNKEM